MTPEEFVAVEIRRLADEVARDVVRLHKEIGAREEYQPTPETERALRAGATAGAAQAFGEFGKVIDLIERAGRMHTGGAA